MTIKVKEVVKYGGHTLSANGSVNLTLKAGYSELPNSIKTMQMLNNDISINVKLSSGTKLKLGYFRIKSVNFDGDGESTLKFNGLNDFIEMDNLNLLPLKNEDGINEFTILMKSEIEEEGEDNDED